MPLLSTLGNASAKGFGFSSFKQQIVNGFITTIEPSLYFQDITYDTSGNAYVLGWYQVSFFSTGRPFIMKLEAGTGALLWSYSLTSGNVNNYPAGYGAGAVFSSGNLLVYYDNKIYKISSSGSLVEARAVSNNFGYGGANGNIKVDSSGNIYLCNWGYNTDFSAEGANVVKLNSSYTVQWNKSYTFNRSGWTVSFRPAGGRFNMGLNNQISLSGYWQDNAYTQPREGQVITIDTSGNVVESSSISGFSSGASGMTYPSRTTDSDGNIYTIGGADQFNSSTGGTYIIKQTSGGSVSWQKRVTNTSLGYHSNIAADSAGNVYIAQDGLTTYGKPGMAKLNTSGSLLWNKQFDNSFAGESILANISNGLNLLYLTFSPYSESDRGTLLAIPTQSGPTNATYANNIVVTSPSLTLTNSSLTITTRTPTVSTVTNPTISTPSVSLYSYTPPPSRANSTVTVT